MPKIAPVLCELGIESSGHLENLLYGKKTVPVEAPQPYLMLCAFGKKVKGEADLFYFPLMPLTFSHLMTWSVVRKIWGWRWTTVVVAVFEHVIKGRAICPVSVTRNYEKKLRCALKLVNGTYSGICLLKRDFSCELPTGSSIFLPGGV
ncbi:hypothetical protein VNO77_44539 [Canavalia gladiata]|uniref:Uncharacterized protein n=1 Tax=Canavalia gladiata TaxID=3824 RepID=A0AAN9PNW0_CANGL